MDRSTHPPKVERLHYVFSGWLGDVLLESFPSFIVTNAAQAAVQAQGLSGVQFGAVEVTKSEEFDEQSRVRKLPDFRWLKVSGKAGADDFGIGSDHRLVVSERALDVLKPFGLAHALIEDYRPA